MTEQDFTLQYDGRVLFIHVCVGREPKVAATLLEDVVAACRGPDHHATACWTERFDREEAADVGTEVKRIADASTSDEIFMFHICINTDQDTDQVAAKVRAVALGPKLEAASVLAEEYTGEAGRQIWTMLQDLTKGHAPTEAPPEPELKMLRILTCGTHGNRKWVGHVMCSNCGRIWQTQNAKKPRFAPFECKCGAQLRPDEEDRVGDALGLFNKDGSTAVSTKHDVSIQLRPYKDGDFSARAICDHCFRKIDKRFGGKVPNYETAMKAKLDETKVVKN